MNIPKTPYTMNMEAMALSTAQIQFSINMGTTALIILITVHSTDMPAMHLGLWTEREIIMVACLLTNMQKE